MRGIRGGVCNKDCTRCWRVKCVVMQDWWWCVRCDRIVAVVWIRFCFDQTYSQHMTNLIRH